jgi:hypothetical protein
MHTRDNASTAHPEQPSSIGRMVHWHRVMHELSGCDCSATPQLTPLLLPAPVVPGGACDAAPAVLLVALLPAALLVVSLCSRHAAIAPAHTFAIFNFKLFTGAHWTSDMLGLFTSAWQSRFQ